MHREAISSHEAILCHLGSMKVEESTFDRLRRRHHHRQHPLEDQVVLEVEVPGEEVQVAEMVDSHQMVLEVEVLVVLEVEVRDVANCRSHHHDRLRHPVVARQEIPDACRTVGNLQRLDLETDKRRATVEPLPDRRLVVL